MTNKDTSSTKITLTSVQYISIFFLGGLVTMILLNMVSYFGFIGSSDAGHVSIDGILGFIGAVASTAVAIGLFQWQRYEDDKQHKEDLLQRQFEFIANQKQHNQTVLLYAYQNLSEKFSKLFLEHLNNTPEFIQLLSELNRILQQEKHPFSDDEINGNLFKVQLQFQNTFHEFILLEGQNPKMFLALVQLADKQLKTISDIRNLFIKYNTEDRSDGLNPSEQTSLKKYIDALWEGTSNITKTFGDINKALNDEFSEILGAEITDTDSTSK